MKKFEHHIVITSANTSIITELSQHCSLTNSQLKQAIGKGALWLTKGKTTTRLRRIKKKLSVGDNLHFYYDEHVLNQTPNKAQLIADLNDYSVWYKPYGMLSQGSKWSDHCTIARWAQTHLSPERQTFIVHRLDRAATGLIMIAHSKQAARLLTNMFEQHALNKHYRIIVHGNHSNRPQPDILAADVDGKTACSTFTHLDYNEEHDISLVQVKIDSGRKHQIRKHAAGIVMPVVGDRLHGKFLKDDNDDKREQETPLTSAEQINLQLCAVSLSFTCPLSEEQREFVLPTQLMPSLAALVKQLS